MSVSGESAREIYAVGADLGDGEGPNFLAYDGQSWRRLSTGVEAGDLWWISVEAIDGAFYLAGDPGLIVRFDPILKAFEQHVTPGDPTLFGVWGETADDLWAVGGDLSNPDTGGVLWHFDGLLWQAVDLSNILPNGLPLLYKVWGRSRSEVYVVGTLCTVLRFDGANWSLVECDSQRSLFTVHGNADLVIGVGGFADGVIAEYADGIFANRAPAGLPQMNGVFVPATGTPVAVGIEASLAIRTTAGWELQETRLNTIRDFHAVWVDPEGGIWAVGGNLSTELNDGIVAYFGSRTISTTIDND